MKVEQSVEQDLRFDHESGCVVLLRTDSILLF